MLKDMQHSTLVRTLDLQSDNPDSSPGGGVRGVGVDASSGQPSRSSLLGRQIGGESVNSEILLVSIANINAWSCLMTGMRQCGVVALW